VSTHENKALYMATLGCPKNRVDFRGDARDPGSPRLHAGGAAEDASVIVVNTCAFIGPAKQESVDTILELAELKKSGRCNTLVVTGCLSQRYGPELAKEMPEVDHFLGTGAYVQIGDLLAAEAAPRQVIPDPDYVHDARTPKVNSSPKWTAYLKISEGCDNACAFCIIPTLRGAQRSRPIDDLSTRRGPWPRPGCAS
jgi:ribosomal protein S12 methylthiotransferase